MIKKLLLSLIVIFLSINVLLAQQATFKGVVKNTAGEAIEHATVFLIKEGKNVNVAYSDENGEYQMFGVQPGTYDMKVDGPPMTCGNTVTKEKNPIRAGDVVWVNFEINCATGLDPVVITYEPPVFDATKTQSSVRMSGDDLRKTPGRSITRALSAMEGITATNGSIQSVRGNRSDGQKTIIDGVTVRGNQAIAQSAIGDAEMIMGGIPAEYGDGTSFIVITTRGISEKFNGSVEVRGSLEGYNNFLVAASVMGPILKGKKADDPSRIGFLLSAEAHYDKDNDPAQGGTWRIKDDVLDRISKTPILYDDPFNINVNHNAIDYLKAEDFEKVRVRRNASEWGYLVNAKLDFLPAKDGKLRLSVGGSYQFDKFKSWSRANALMNYNYLPEEISSTLRVNARLNHRVYTSTKDTSIFKNFMYDLGVSYELYDYKVQSSVHKDNFFRYGHIGYFNRERRPFYSRQNEYSVKDSLGNVTNVLYGFVILQNIYDSVIRFTPGEYNPVLANYTSTFTNTYSPEMVMENLGAFYDYEQYRSFGALLNGDAPNSAYTFFNAPGTSSGASYLKQQLSKIEANASISMNLANHEIKLGFVFEKRTDRYYALAARSLWTLMRQLENVHMQQLDYANPIFRHDTVDFNWFVNPNQQSVFDRNVRVKLGLDPTGYDNQYIDIDSYDPDQFSMDMFSPEELLLGVSGGSSAMISLYGYDYTGKKISSKTDITRFFTSTNDQGQKTYELGAYEPIYMAMYIQDKFSIQSLMFNVGIRVDRFDANQDVLADPFLFREAYNVKSLKEKLAEEGKNFQDFNILYDPSNPSKYDNYVVYIDQLGMDYSAFDNSRIIAYRNDYQWYNANGQEIVNPEAVLTTIGGPLLKSQPDGAGEITKVTAGAFTRYKPQWSWMPRFAFSFPVSDQSHFTAHYTIMTNRPTNLRLNPVDYLFVEKLGSNKDNHLNNPNLKLQRSVDYEIGFSQKIGEKSAITINAYYSEKKDQITIYRYTGAYPTTYYSYRNMDFGTTQGFSFSYSMQRYKNINFKASYSLQFAKGTGSDANTQAGIVSAGQPNLRTLSNLSFDQRHRLSAMFGYYFDGGAKYKGPQTDYITKSEKKKTIRWFENVGANLVFSAASGLPYSKSSMPNSDYNTVARRLEGNINGSFKPWVFQCDLNISKTFVLKTKDKKNKEGKEIKNSGKDTYLMVYLEVLNIFNFKNILSVYDYTGNADDDGYLTSPAFQTTINNNIDVLAYRNYYSMIVSNPYNFGTPTRVSLGISFSF